MPTSGATNRHKLKHLAAVIVAGIVVVVVVPALLAQQASFHHAPTSAAAIKNPYAGQHQAVVAGERIYSSKCSNCHGENGEGTGVVPSLAKGRAQKAQAGELFWFITHGSVDNGMPSWAKLPEKQRWQVVTYLKSLGAPSKSQAKGQ